MLDALIPDGHPDWQALRDLRTDLEASWSATTSFWPDEWSEHRPSHGQCAVTALVVHDRFGGEILRTVNAGVLHYWNRIAGTDVDLTRDQFATWAPEEPVTTIDPADLLTSGPTLAIRYQHLTTTLAEHAGAGVASSTLPPPPSSAERKRFRPWAVGLAAVALLALVLGGALVGSGAAEPALLGLGGGGRR